MPVTRRLRGFAIVCAAALGGCASDPRSPPANEVSPSQARALVATLLPPAATDRAGWATDIYAAFAAMNIAASEENVCAVVAVTEQESSFRADPPVANLAAITWDEIDRRAERLGVPKLVVRGALQLSSPNGKSYGERIDAAKTEKELSEIFEDFIGMVPLGRTLFAGWNPVRTGGPMQVSIAFAEDHAGQKTYPYPVTGSLRHEVFTRRGGMYFGIAHLLDYPAAYDRPIYRFADFNAGRYASRNAALQNAISVASGIPLALDGDLVRHDGDTSKGPGATERAALVLAERLDLNESQIRRALEQGDSLSLERTSLYQRAFALADKLEGRRLPRAVLPRIALQGPKIRRKLTTEWFAQRVDERWRRCMARAPAASG
jgi:hypothetical protein